VQFSRSSLTLFLLAAVAAVPAIASRVHRAPTSGHTQGPHKAVRKSHKLHGQQAIDSSRVTQIQQALIREHYMNGDANGNWDTTTQAAMQKFQADQGWQTKLMPDSRALKKLGLGPDYSNAINAKNSTFADPPAVSTIPPDQSSGFAAAAGINR
jgi:peptidoglycan hydrolase-like protein with peptidoglycan-binding domain